MGCGTANKTQHRGAPCDERELRSDGHCMYVYVCVYVLGRGGMEFGRFEFRSKKSSTAPFPRSRSPRALLSLTRPPALFGVRRREHGGRGHAREVDVVYLIARDGDLEHYAVVVVVHRRPCEAIK